MGLMAKVSGAVLIVVRGPVAATLQGRVSERLSGTQSSVSCDLSKGSTHFRPFLEVHGEMVQLIGQNKKPSAKSGALTRCAELCAEMLTPALCRQRAECFLFMTWSSSISPRVNVSPDSTLVRLALSYTTSPSP